jgi:hypothetical protein
MRRTGQRTETRFVGDDITGNKRHGRGEGMRPLVNSQEGTETVTSPVLFASHQCHVSIKWHMTYHVVKPIVP